MRLLYTPPKKQKTEQLTVETQHRWQKADVRSKPAGSLDQTFKLLFYEMFQNLIFMALFSLRQGRGGELKQKEVKTFSEIFFKLRSWKRSRMGCKHKRHQQIRRPWEPGSKSDCDKTKWNAQIKAWFCPCKGGQCNQHPQTHSAPSFTFT